MCIVLCIMVAGGGVWEGGRVGYVWPWRGRIVVGEVRGGGAGMVRVGAGERGCWDGWAVTAGVYFHGDGGCW